MYELDVLAGKLSDWSRRNPTAVLPEDFTKIRDRAVGAVWDTSAQHERIWLYGSTWVFMLNVGQNLDDGLTSLMNKKRRPSEYEDDGMSKRIKGASSGAGSRLPASQRAPGYAGSIKITSQDGQSEAVALRSDNDEDGDVAMEDDNDDADGLQLTRLRSEDGAGVVPAQYERKFWGSFKYRPILGMVPLENEGGKGEDVLEVVIVERPADEGRGRAAGR